MKHINSYIVNKGLWVDIGCGAGEILFSAKQSGWQALGFETDKNEIKYAEQKGIEVIDVFLNLQQIENYSSIFQKSKLVSFFNILEHIAEPCELLMAISSKLMSGNYTVIEVPRHPSLSSFNCVAFPELACRHIYPPDHLHIFTEKSLEIMLNKAGLQIVSIWNFGQDVFDLISCAAVKAKKINKGFYENIVSVTLKMQKMVDNSLLSDNMLVIAKKSV